MVTQLEQTAVGERRLRMTFEEFLAWEPEGRQTEWVDGEAIEFMATKTWNADLTSLLFRLIGLFVDIRRLGRIYPATFAMLVREGRSFREPDIVFVAEAHLDRVTPERLVGPADLLVEVVSEDSVTRDRQEKRREYASVGVREYWIVEGREGRHGIEVLALGPDGTYEEVVADADGRIWSRVLPGLWLDPAWLAAEPLPNPLLLLHRIAPDALRAFFASDPER